jgi:hypothetical protein
MQAPALREVVAHLHTSDLGASPWSCPGGECRPIPDWGAFRKHIDEVLSRAPSFELLDALSRALPTSGGVPPDVQAAYGRHRARLDRHGALERDLLQHLSEEDLRLINAREAEDGRLWDSEYAVVVELLIAHMPGLGPTLRMLWEHVRETGFSALTAGRFCCGSVEPTA